jgi:exosortase A-associated hydrolase 1
LKVHEQAVTFDCEGNTLVGVLSRPAAAASPKRSAVLIVVGGPQYRAGSHRQFVLLARTLASAGYPCLRFDYRGMGDSGGEPRTFEGIAADIRAALAALRAACPEQSRIVVWGLCDAASAALMFATSDAGVSGIVAANPWARSEASLAAATVKHYYAGRLLQRSLWTKVFSGRFGWREAAASALRNLQRALMTPRASGAPPHQSNLPFQTAMARGLARFNGRVLLLLSGNDLTAREFVQYASADPHWRGLLQDPKIERVDFAQADHTFSQRRWSAAAESATVQWLNKMERSVPDMPAPSSANDRTRQGDASEVR